MIKHYNGATVWGSLDKFARKVTDNNKPYLEIFLLCQHAVYGNVRVLGRIWGRDTVDEFLDDVRAGKIKKGVDLRLEGNIQQYNGRNEETKTTFNFYRYELGPLKEKKAAFRLVGEVVSFDIGNIGCADYALANIVVIQEQKENFETKREEFEVFVPNAVLLELPVNPSPGQMVRLKGYLQNEEDEFGESKGQQRPIARQVEIVQDIG